MDKKDWLHCDVRIWKGKGFKFYKLDDNNDLFVSTDLLDWRHTEEVWHDINSRQYRLINYELHISNNGNDWQKLDTCFWQSPGGSYYYFDEKLQLYKKKWF